MNLSFAGSVNGRKGVGRVASTSFLGSIIEEVQTPPSVIQDPVGTFESLGYKPVTIPPPKPVLPLGVPAGNAGDWGLPPRPKKIVLKGSVDRRSGRRHSQVRQMS